MMAAVRDAQTGKPVALTNVYLSGTTLGSSTDNKGNFSIEKIPYGTYEFVVSHVAYQLYVKRVPVSMGAKLYYEINLQSKYFEGTEIEVTGDDPEEWRRLFEKFKHAFIGNSQNSTDCKIVNPEVIELRIDEQTDHLIASSDSTIKLENRALGYYIEFILKDFNWKTNKDAGQFDVYTNFIEMDTTDQEKLKEYKQRRLQTFIGSFRHFLSTLAADKLDEENFYVTPNLRKPFGSKRNIKIFDLGVEPAHDLPGYYELRFNGYMRVDYENMASSIILKTDRLIFDQSGNTSEYNLVKYGHWTRERMADFLPFDYVPEESDY
jgi:hypothetical protein